MNDGLGRHVIISRVSLTPSEVKHIATLARLELSEAEIILFCQQLSAILAYVDQLQELETTDILPTSSVLPAYSVLRNDTPRPGLSRAELFRNAPAVEADQFKVPPILD